MAFCRIFVPLLVLCVVQSFAVVEVPVFLWGDLAQTNREYSALSSVPRKDFRLILKHEFIDNPFVVAFIENTLSVEDFSRKIDGETSFPFLEKNIDNSLYLTSVEAPLRALDQLAASEQVDHVKLTDKGLSAELTNEDVRFLLINLEDAKEGESRADLLLRHNDFMEDMMNKLQERYGKVVAMYTARNPSWTVVEHTRVRREAKQNSESNPSVTNLAFGGLRIYFQRVYLNQGDGEKILSGAQGDPASVVDAKFMNSTILFSGDIKATLNFENNAGYWFFNNATLTTPTGEKSLYPQESLFGYSGFSYRCAVNLTLASRERVNATKDVNTLWTLSFENSRMEPFFKDVNETEPFGDPLNCVGFFTAPIWAGLFVVAILLAITFFGIMMMMDIKTMDRFDDPKGKTITINASDWLGRVVSVAILLAITFFGIMMMMDIKTMDRFDDPKGKTITINASE